MSKTIVDKASLYFKEGTSDKEYHLQIVESGDGYVVNFQYGRRGSTLTPGSKTPSPVPLDKAKKVYASKLKEQLGKGYQPMESSGDGYVALALPATPKKALFIPQLLNRIDESGIEKFLLDDNFGAQEKKDGKRQSILRKGGEVTVTNKKGQPVGFPRIFADTLPYEEDLLFDGEAIGETFHVFDMLERAGKDLRKKSYLERHNELVAFYPGLDIVPLAIGYEAKRALYEKLKKEGREGIVFKKLDAPYVPGKAHEFMWKCKFLEDASCRVAEGRDGKRSVGLELLDADGVWQPVGNVTIPANKEIPQVGLVIDVTYLYAFKGGSLFQAVYKGVRDDVAEGECLTSQLKYKAEED